MSDKKKCMECGAELPLWYRPDSCLPSRCIENLKAQISSARKEAFEEKWQPIETAPQDGTTILVYLEAPLLRRSRVATATFHPKVKIVGGLFHFDAPKATHWQPLP